MERSSEAIENPSAADIRSLLLLVLFPGAEPDFAKRLSETIVKLEPTFPPDHNAEILRVMAAACVYTHLEQTSTIANALALGLHAAAYPPARTTPVCDDVMARAVEYLATESERMRPPIPTGDPVPAEQQAAAQHAELKKAVDSGNFQVMAKAAEPVCAALVTAVKESREQFGGAMRRLTEESQFLWWLIGRRSSALSARRDSLTTDAYALPAAAEAAERVTLLPPPASIECLLAEALAQCPPPKRATMSFEELIQAADAAWVQRAAPSPATPELTPIAALLATRRAGARPDAKHLKQLSLQPKSKISPTDASGQYFRELMFLWALADIK